MIIKIVCVSTIILISAYVGYEFSKHYIKREHFFSSLIMFCEMLKTDLLFFQTRTKEIFSSRIDNFDGDFALLLNFYAEEKTIDNPCKMLLKEAEIKKVDEFFESIGKLDAENQCKIVDGFVIEFKRLHEKSIEEKNRFGKLGLKMGLCFGCVISILCL